VTKDGAFVDVGSAAPAFLPNNTLAWELEPGDDLSGLLVCGHSATGQLQLTLENFECENVETPESTQHHRRGHGRGHGCDRRCRNETGTSKAHKTVCYPREELLRLRQLDSTGDRAVQVQLPGLSSYPTAELDQLLIACAEGGQLPPRSWNRCSDHAKRDALLAVLRGGHMHAVFAMRPQSQHFRDELGCEPADVTFLNDAMAALCADAVAGCRIPLAQPVRWLLEQGASVALLLPIDRISHNSP